MADLDVVLPPRAPDGVTHAYHLFPIQVDHRRGVFDGMREAGIGVQVHYVPVHHHPISADLGLQRGDLPVCDAIYSKLLSLPIFPGLTDADQDRVVATLASLL